MATHSSILAWKIPWTEEPGGLQFIGLQTFSIGVNFLDKSYRPQSTGKNSSVHGILQARILEWAAIFFSRDLPDPGIEPGSPALQADSLPSEPPGKSTGKETPIQRQFVLSYCK